MRRILRLLVSFGVLAALIGVAGSGEPAAAAPVAAAASPAVSLPAAVTTASGVRGIDRRCKIRGRVLCIDKTRDRLYYMKNGRILRSMDARFGCARTRTREGRFRVFRKSRNHVSSIYHTPMPYSMFFSGGQAVHYSPDFARRGYNGCSHGCVNVRNRTAIRWVFNRVRIGDRVVVYRS